jgi:very-long-chain ceramide synthase
MQLPTRSWNPIDLWVGYPHIPLAGTVKFYYLTQTAFYTHQMLILNAEARRKDHWQMMTHHVVTVFLMGASYLYNFTRVGCLIMMLMDLSDVFLPVSLINDQMSSPAHCNVARYRLLK